MIDIKNYKKKAKLKDDDNMRFRRALKNRDHEEVDKIFREAHDYVFSNIIDCKDCMNCCKECKAEFTIDEIKKISNHVNLSIEVIKNLCDFDFIGQVYRSKDMPCRFLENNKCTLEECKPKVCREFPYTNKPEMTARLLNLVVNTYVCPAVYEILEYVKSEVRFRDSLEVYEFEEFEE